MAIAMRVLICPDSFKGCLDAESAAHTMRRGVLRSGAHEIDECPMSDGGEGFTQAIARANGVELQTHPALSAAETTVDAPYCVFETPQGMTAAFTVADIVGLSMLDPKLRNPVILTALGVGAFMRCLIEVQSREHDCSLARILIGLGGSGTIEGGIGISTMTGWRMRYKRPRWMNWNSWHRDKLLLNIRSIEPSPHDSFPDIEVVAAHDVTNPLTGPNGAARVFGPQKGATPRQVERLDAGLANLHRVCIEAGLTDGTDHPGDGAAGGLGFGLRVFAGATLTPGAQVVIEATNLRERIMDADLVITGEGMLDSQSTSGKAAWAIGTLAKELGTPCVCLAGSFGDGWKDAADAFTRAIRATPEGMDPSEGIANAEKLIEEAASGLPELSPGR